MMCRRRRRRRIGGNKMRNICVLYKVRFREYARTALFELFKHSGDSWTETILIYHLWR